MSVRIVMTPTLSRALLAKSLLEAAGLHPYVAEGGG